MNRPEMIQAWKENLCQWRHLSSEMNAFATQTGKGPFVMLLENGEWTSTTGGGFSDNIVYRLRPDYQEEPEEIVCEVLPRGRHLIIEYAGNECRLASAIGWIPKEGYRFAGFRYAGSNDESCMPCRWDERNLSIHFPTHAIYRK